MSYENESPSDKDITWKNVKILYEYKDDRGRGYWLRVGHWVVNGRELEMTIEKRSFTQGDSGFVRQGKTQGFNKADLYRIFSMAGELAAQFRFPLPKVVVADRDDAPAVK